MPRPVARKWVRGPADEIAVEAGCTFDLSAASHVVEFIETFCCHSKGKWAGQAFKLLPWQRDWITRLYGWKRPNGTRRFRTAYLEVPKKNGKSTMVSALGLYHLIADGEAGAEVYINAYDKEQALIIYNEAERTVKASRALGRVLEPKAAVKRIVHPDSNSYLVANSADVPSKDGFSASLTIFDELHRQKTRAMWDIFEYAGASREQPLTLSITTAGEDLESICWEQHRYSDQVNRGLIPDWAHFGVIYAADPADPIEDPATWHKANPSLGTTLSLDDFRADVAKALAEPRKLANFRRLKLNIWGQSDDVYLDQRAWAECGKIPVDPAALIGQICWAGGDLSSVDDLSALVTIFGDPEEGFDVLARFWLPEDDILELERRHRAPYRAWADQGYITLTPGNAIDYAFIRKEILEQYESYDLRVLFLDRYNAQQLGTQLAEEDGLPVEFLPQGMLSLSGPTKELARLVKSGKLRHGANPILDWMAANAVAQVDVNENVRLVKKRSRQKIDGIAALVNALAGATSAEASAYESHGIQFI